MFGTKICSGGHQPNTHISHNDRHYPAQRTEYSGTRWVFGESGVPNWLRGLSTVEAKHKAVPLTHLFIHVLDVRFLINCLPPISTKLPSTSRYDRFASLYSVFHSERRQETCLCYARLERLMTPTPQATPTLHSTYFELSDMECTRLRSPSSTKWAH